VKPTVWTTRRKVLGNLIPAIVWLIPTTYGLAVMATSRILLGPGLILLGVSTVLGWLALNSFGLFENLLMQKELEQILKNRKDAPAPESWFVGLTTPKYRGLLDAHEDVGFLEILPDRLSFTSETRRLEFLATEVRSVRYRVNVHSLVLLGRWVSVEGVSAGKPVRMLLEPRERPTMLGNFRESGVLFGRLSKWAKGKS